MRIPYRVVGGKSFYDRREVKDLLSYLAAIVNPDDDQALLRIISTPPRGIGAVTVEMAVEESAKAHCSVQNLMLSPEFLDRCTRKTAGKIEEFAQTLQTLRIRCATPGADLSGILANYLSECGYFDDLQRSCKTPEEYLNRESNVKEMLNTLGQFQNRSNQGLQGFLDEMSLDRDREEDKEDKSKGVTLITLHAAKGLEFPHVFLVGAEDGLLPHSRSLGEGTLDEERRLFYVGITRARRSLTITHCHQRNRYGSTMPCSPSRFLEEIEGDGVEVKEYGEFLTEEPDEDYAFAQFSRLRSLMEEE
jgi:DNA helicase II / ATP-dependent DNA helicase PcrA